METLKKKIYDYCIETLNNKAKSLNNSLRELSESTLNDSKSSFGDKYETAQSMMQIEQEKTGKQLKEVLDQLAVLKKIDITQKPEHVIKGSLINTNKGYIFLSVGLGKITVDKENVIVLSPQSPLGTKLLGASKGHNVNLNGNEYSVLGLS